MSMTSPSYTSAIMQDLGNGVTPSNFMTHGGAYAPPDGLAIGYQLNGPNDEIFAREIVMRNAPEGGIFEGNVASPDVISVGQIAPGSTNTFYNLFDLLDSDEEDYLRYTASTSVLNYLGNGRHTPSLQVGGSPVCTTASPCGITALTGDVAASGSGSVSATLATVNSNVGTFGSAASIPVVTVNAKGLITGVTTATPPGGFTGSCAPTTTITVVNGLITGCS